MRNRIILGALLALPFAAAGLPDDAAAEQTRWSRALTYRYSEMDADRDRVITRSEWTGTRQAFNAADVNRDGVLSGDELRLDTTNNQAVGTSGTAATYDNSYHNTYAARVSQFQSFDRNRDGIVNRSEWTGSRAQFTAQDLDRDGVISRREYAGDEPVAQDTWRGRRNAADIVDVDARTRWVSTGLVVTQGQTIMFNATGSVQLSDDGNDVAGAAGANSGRKAAGAPLGNELAGALIGRIGTSPAFGVGNQRSITAPASGELFLGVNDDHLDDNRGRFRVRVSVR